MKAILLLAAFVYSASMICGTPLYAKKLMPVEEVGNHENEPEEKVEAKSIDEKGDNETDADKENKTENSKKQAKGKNKDGKNDRERDSKRVIKELKDSIATQDTRLKLKQNEIDSLKRDLDELLPFRLEFLKNLCNDAKEFEELPFSAFSQEKIDSIRKKIHPFLSYSPELTENDTLLLNLNEKKGIYESFLALMDTIPYGEELLKSYSNFQTSLLPNVNLAQQEEISAVAKKMETYPILIPEFEDAIEEFKIQLEYARNNNDLSEARDMSKVTLKMNEGFQPIKESMKEVPYMESLFKEYLDLLSGNNPLDERILQIEATVASMAEALSNQTNNK